MPILKEIDLDKATIDAYHSYVQRGIRNDLNSVSLGPGRFPFRLAIALIVFGFCFLLVGILLVALRMKHVYLWDWNAQFLGPFFVILFLLCMSGASYLFVLAKRRSNKYRSQLYFKPVGDWGINCVHKSQLAREDELKHELKSGTNPHKTVKPRSEAYSKDAQGRPRQPRGDGRDNQAYDKSPLDANQQFRPDEHKRGPPPDGRRGPPPDGRRGPPPQDGRRGPPPDGRRGPPPDGHRGPPPHDGRRGPPPEGRRGPPPGEYRGHPDDRPRGHPDDRPRGPPNDRPRGPPNDRPRGPPNDRPRGPPDERPRGPPPEYRTMDDRGHSDRDRPRRSPPPGRRSPPPGRRGPDDRRPPPNGAQMEEGGRHARGVPRFGAVERIPDEDRQDFKLILNSSRDASEI